MLRSSPMGWNSWDCYGPSVTEEIVRKNAEVMAEKLKDHGWEYVVVDIQWYQPSASAHEYDPFADLTTDVFGRLLPAVNRFPSSAGGAGFSLLADYVHSLGLKFGIHIMRGIPRQAVHRNLPIYGADGVTARQAAKTDSICAWNTDMYGLDPKKPGAREYLRGCGREMVLSLSPGPALLEKAELYKQNAEMWRITDDFWDDWKLLYAMFERCEKWSIHTGSGHYPDADMLPVGAILQNYDEKNRTKFTEDEQKTMMALWSIFRSPLMIGGDLGKLDSFTEELLTNDLILDMHRDSRHAHQVWRRNIGDQEHVLWTAVSAKGGQYMAVFNLSDSGSSVDIPLSDIEADLPSEITDLWTGKKAAGADTVSCSIPSHGCAAFLIK